MKFETLQVHSGQHVDNETLSRGIPLYLTTAYLFRSAAHGARLFELKEFGNIYTRLQNPTTDIFEQRCAALEGGVAALATASGMAAQLIAITSIVEVGENFVSSPYLYGGSYNQFTVSFKKLGIECRMAENDSVGALAAQINDKTKAIFVESIANPAYSIAEIDKIADLAHSHKIPLIVDNTFGCCGFLCRPIDFGADIVIHSASKWIGGHGEVMGGVIIDSGKFNWAASGKFAGLTQPSEGYHGLVFADAFGELAYIIKARVEGLRDLGACQSPFNSHQMLLGLETLSLRVERQAANTLALAHWFESQPQVEQVLYPGLEGDANYAKAKKYLQHGFGCVLSVVLKGDTATTARVVERLKLVSHLTNVGDCKTIVTHPASTTHQQLSPEAQIAGGVYPTLLRISLGIEHIDDIVADFAQAFR